MERTRCPRVDRPTGRVTSRKDLAARVSKLEAWAEVVMRTLAALGLGNLLIELDEARRAYDEERARLTSACSDWWITF